jgi:hypothetical protein
MPPASRNQRVPTGGDIPAPIAAASLGRPAAINAQKRSRSSRRAIPGRPGDLNLSRNARSDRRLPAITTFFPVVLRRPVESAQYCSVDYQAELGKHGVLISMSATGNCYDNAMVETFFKTLKSELVWRTVFYTRQQATQTIGRYIDGFYNPVRRHSALDFTSPVQFEKMAAE